MLEVQPLEGCQDRWLGAPLPAWASLPARACALGLDSSSRTGSGGAASSFRAQVRGHQADPRAAPHGGDIAPGRPRRGYERMPFGHTRSRFSLHARQRVDVPQLSEGDVRQEHGAPRRPDANLMVRRERGRRVRPRPPSSGVARCGRWPRPGHRRRSEVRLRRVSGLPREASWDRHRRLS